MKTEWQRMMSGGVRCGKWQVFQMQKGTLWYVYFGSQQKASFRSRRIAITTAEVLMSQESGVVS